jgi:hypothetical protein
MMIPELEAVQDGEVFCSALVEEGQGQLSSLPILQLGPRRTATATTRSNGSLPGLPLMKRGQASSILRPSTSAGRMRDRLA